MLNHRQHLRSLDGLRGLAVLLVFCFHYAPRQPGNPFGLAAGLGWLGVDLFFVLSGFLITGILLDTRHQPGYFSKFYARRALRLFPVYCVMVAVVLALTVHGGGRPTVAAAPFLLYGSNIVGDLQLSTGLTPSVQLGHLWSLALEEQFYLLWPPLLFLLRTPRRIGWACICGIALSVALRWLLLLPGVAPHYTPYIELPTRLDGLLGGGLLALLLRSPRGVRSLTLPRLRSAAAVGALVLLASVAVARAAHWSSRPMVHFGYSAAALLFCSTIALALHQGSVAQRIGDWRPLRVLGRYSYGFYLWHQLPEDFFRSITARGEALLPWHGLGAWFGLVVVFAISFAIAWVSYHAVELPFLRLKRLVAYRDESRVNKVQVDMAEAEPVDPVEPPPLPQIAAGQSSLSNSFAAAERTSERSAPDHHRTAD